MSVIIDIPFGLKDLDKIFEVCELLDNREELVKEFTPEVSKYIVKESFFTGPFRQAYLKHFDELIVSLIKRQITKHFPSYTPEEVMLLCDQDFLKMITENYYFEPKNYMDNKYN